MKNNAADDPQQIIVDLRRRLDESIAQQVASSEVLRIISASPGALTPVFEAIVKSAVDLCEARFGAVFRMEGDLLHLVTDYNFGSTQRQLLGAMYPMAPNRGHISGRAVLTGSAVHIADIYTDEDYKSVEAKKAGFRSLLAVPLLQSGRAIGSIVIYRTEPGPFTARQSALLQTFADQAVIAIENARLFDETQEALERQTATAEILKVIASSPSDVQPVFEAIATSAKRLLGGFSTAVFRILEATVHLAAFTPVNPVADRALKADFPQSTENFVAFRLAQHGEPVVIADTEKESHAPVRDIARLHGFRSMLWVPMVNGGVTIGIISVTRAEPGRFAPHHIQLLQTFADQAVIAIENVRLFDETREALERQTATAEILASISSSSADPRPVFEAILRNLLRLFGTRYAIVVLVQNDILELVGIQGEPGFEKMAMGYPRKLDDTTFVGKVILEGHAKQVVPVIGNPEATLRTEQWGREFGFNSLISVPLMQQGKVIGGISTAHRDPVRFTEKQVDLIKSFADQAVIAIENTRLLQELRQRTGDLTQSLEDLRTAQDRLVQTEKLASLGQLTAGIAHEIKNPLNFVNNFSALSAELVGEMKDMLSDVGLDKNKREDLDEITQMLKSNLDKVVQHGKRADSIVKNMLLHSRQGSGEHRPVDINSIVDESLTLAYHGARAENTGFNITMHRSFDSAAGMADGYPQEITRALLNLISNGFYAATKRKSDAGDGFEPTLTATTKNLGDKVEIRIRDNGTGIRAEIKEKIFNPFFTTKPAGEGTGLGLSMSHDIIVKQHGGTMDVDSVPGVFTEFKIVLPRAGHPLSSQENIREPAHSRGR